MSKPILFTKTGVIASEPLDFYDELAEAYDADLHITDDVCLELYGSFVKTREAKLAVREETQARTRKSLQDGRNSVYDGYLNTEARRDTILHEVAGPAGAVTVMLCVHAPIDLIEKRVKERFTANQLSVPSAMTSLEETLKVAENMSRTVNYPAFNDGHVLNLNGALSSGHLIDRVDQFLARQGIV